MRPAAWSDPHFGDRRGAPRPHRARRRGAPRRSRWIGTARTAAEATPACDEEGALILVDTNAWISHLRASDVRLERMLAENRVVTCEVVLGELLLGSGVPRVASELLDLLPKVPTPTAAQTLAFVQRRRATFASSGVGWADAQIVVAAIEAGALLHSSDLAVRRVWKRLGLRAP